MPQQLTIKQVLLEYTNKTVSLSETSRMDGEVLLGHVMGRNRSWVMAHPEFELSMDQVQLFNQLSSRVLNGEPLPYILGYWEFFGLSLTINQNVLIPRPETEVLLEAALDWLQKHPQKRLGIDIGTGSGCIALALATHIPDLKMIATDVSGEALRVASQNIRSCQATDRIHLVQADLLSPFSATHQNNSGFDLIVANLPYIPTRTLQTLNVKNNEPWGALDGGVDGLRDIRRVLGDAPAILAEGGYILLEIEASQGDLVKSLATQVFPGKDINIIKDLAGLDRVLVVESI
jgi:release factor glutamine methyltransferase